MAEEDHNSLIHVSPALTHERLNRALSDWFKEPYIFTHWEYVSNTGKGDSYLSEVMRIKIFGKNQTGVQNHAQVVLKYIPKNVARRLTLRSDEFFKNEINFYEKVLPALLEFQSTKNIPEPFDKCPKLFLTYCNGTDDVIGLEDAGIEGYRPAFRQKGIDLEHCKLIYKILAQFHALSFAMKDQQPKEFAKLSEYIFETFYDERLWDWYSRFWKRISGIAIDAVEKEYPNSIYAEKIKKFAVPERYQDLINAVKKTKATGVISHGDTWTNNFLFKYENSRLIGSKIIDFQLARCASPVLDLSLATFGCTDQTLRLKHYDELLKYYHDVLSTQIRNMGSDPDKIYPWEHFMDEVKKYSYFGLAFSLGSTPLIVLAPEDAFNMDLKGDQKLNIDDVWPLGPFKTKEGRLREANNIVHCVDKGYI